MKLRVSLTIALLAVSASACGLKSTPTASSATSMTPSVSFSPNVVVPSAAKTYRNALELSLATANTTGLTELWTDVAGALVTVVVQNTNNGTCAQSDLVAKDTQVIDCDGMMPSVLLAELDGLEASTGTDVGYVKSTTSGKIEVANFIDDIHYVTSYSLDDSGRIASAKQFAEGELAATAAFTYSVTSEGAQALKAIH